MTTAQEGPPHCFGKLWDPKTAECAGGVDPAFKDKETGSNLRGRCIYFDSCGSKLQASRMEPARGLLDPRSLMRNSPPLLPPAKQEQPPNQVAAFVQRFAQSVQHQQQQQAMVPVQQQLPQQMKGQVMMVPQQQFNQQMQVPVMPYGYQQMMPVNYQMPGYLTVPEMKAPEQSFWGFALRTVFRSMGKSAGHSIAHLFDTVPLGPPLPGHPPGSGVGENGS